MKQIEDESKARANKQFVAEQAQREQETPRVGRLLLLYVDDEVADITPFGDVRQHAFKIMPREALQIAGLRLSEKPASKLATRWQVVDGLRSVSDATYVHSMGRSTSPVAHQIIHGSPRSPGC
jgi:hypothetical protein